MSELPLRMRAVAEGALESLRSRLTDLEPATLRSRIGQVTRVGDGVASVEGLHRAFVGELVDVGGALGVIEELHGKMALVVLLEAQPLVGAGAVVRQLGRVADVPTGPELIGRVLDPLGRPLDAGGPVHARRRVRVENAVVPLRHREPVSRPLRTGVFVLDTMIPIGLGQRQLIIGDRSTGKTELCLDVLAGMSPDIIGVYAAIGRRGAEAAAHLQWLREHGVLERGFAVIADADDPPGLVHLTPYAATAMAEGLSEEGRDVLVVYDDLTAHANVHRTLALLLGRPVGREAHPADVFYAHARLLERAGQLGSVRGGGSLTAFPIIETQLGDLSGFIPTNLVSITDGQVRLDAGLVAAGVVPGVDIGSSVSRVGGKAQPPIVRRLAGELKNRYAQFLELETFARFGTRLETKAQQQVDWGRRVRRVLVQGRGESRSWSDTVSRLLIVGADGFASIPDAELDQRVAGACAAMQRHEEVQRVQVDEAAVGVDAIDQLRRVAQGVL